MAWTPDFLQELQRTRLEPRYLLEVAPVPAYLPGAGLNLHSHSGRSGRPEALSLQGASVRAGQLNLGEWTHTTGELSIGIRSDRDPRKQIPRGALVRLRMGFPGWDVGAYQPIFLGQYQDCRWTGSQWQLSARSITGALNSRFSQSYTDSALFWVLTETTLTDPYAPTDSTLDLGSTSSFEQLTGGKYLAQVFPDSGDPFFLTATGKSSSQLTGVSSSGAIGTTASAASAGARVVICAYLQQHPVDAVLTLLTSTGTGAAGPYDLAPATWGMGLPHAYVDLADCLQTRGHVSPGAGSVLWDVYSTTRQLNPASWLQSWLSPAGLWIGERQGQLTVRAVKAPGEVAYEVGVIRDREIVAFRSYSAWDPSRPVEHALVTQATVGGSSAHFEGHLDTRPALAEVRLEHPFIADNQSNWRAKLNTRVGPYHTHIGEVFEIEMVGFRLAHLCPGDHVLISSRWLPARMQPEGLSLVTSVQPNWFGPPSTTIRAVHLQQRKQFK